MEESIKHSISNPPSPKIIHSSQMETPEKSNRHSFGRRRNYPFNENITCSKQFIRYTEEIILNVEKGFLFFFFMKNLNYKFSTKLRKFFFLHEFFILIKFTRKNKKFFIYLQKICKSKVKLTYIHN